MHFRNGHRRKPLKLSWVLLLFQANLLLIYAVHHHGSLADLFHRQAAIQCAGSQSASSDSNVFCMTCQVVRQGAARPALAAQALRPDAVVLLLSLPSVAIHPSFQQVVVFSRAPPLT
jgi:hypothetical protein